MPMTGVFFILNVYLIIFEREGAQAEDGQRERERDSQAGSTLPVQSPMEGSIPRTVRS